MSIAPKLQLILDTKAGLKAALNVPSGTPFSQYKNWINWKGTTPPSDLLFADYTKDRYSVSGVPASFSDVNEFTRLTAATNFTDGKLVEYAANKPRIEAGKGLLVEPEATNYWVHSGDLSGVTNKVNTTFVGGAAVLGFPERSELFYVMHLPTSVTTVTMSSIVSANRLPITGWFNEGGAFRYGSQLSTQVSPLGSGYYRYTSGALAASTLPITGLLRQDIITGVTDPEIKVYGLQVEHGNVYSSLIQTKGSPATRSPDLNRITVPLGKTLTLDADAGVSFVMENTTTALITATKPAYIRSARVN